MRATHLFRPYGTAPYWLVRTVCGRYVPHERARRRATKAVDCGSCLRLWPRWRGA